MPCAPTARMKRRGDSTEVMVSYWMKKGDSTQVVVVISGGGSVPDKVLGGAGRVAPTMGFASQGRVAPTAVWGGV